MVFGSLGSDIELGIVIEAIDKASDVVEGIGRAMESVITTTADFQTSLTSVQNNTVLTSANVAQMRQDVLALGRDSGAPLDDLAQAFMRATNLGFNMADAEVVVKDGMESAISTGSRTSDVVQTLALQMHEFGLQASQAGEAMNVLHLAAALGNSTLEEFSTSTTKATSMAANLGIPLTQVDAALAALSRHESLSDANTQVAGFFAKLVNPAKQTATEIANLSKLTGVDLVNDFTAAGFAAKGLPGVLADMEKATHGNVTEMLKLIPATRGGLAEMILLGTGSKDYRDILLQLNEAMGGQLDPTTQAYQRTLGTFNQQMAIVKTDISEFVMDVGKPVLIALQPELEKLITYMTTHQKDITAFGASLGHDIGGAVQGITADIPPLIAQVGKLTDAFKDFGTQSKQTGDFLKNLTTDNPQNYLLHPPGTSANAPGILGNFLLHPPGTSDSAPAALMDFLLHPPGTSPNAPGNLGGFLGNLLLHGPSSSWPGLGNGLSGPPIPPGAGVGLGNNLYGPVLLPRLPASDAGGSQLGGGRGGFPGGGGYFTGTNPPPLPGPNPAAILAAAQAALTSAQQQFSIDQLKGSSQSVLLGDIKTILIDLKAPILGNTPKAIELQQLQLTQQIAVNTATGAQAALTTAQQRLQIDQLKDAPQTKLMADVAAIMKDFANPALRNTPTAVELEHLQLLQQINGNAKTTATSLTPPNILAAFSLAHQAGYGQSIISFGNVVQASQAEMIRQLQAQLTALQQKDARDERQITILQEELAILRQLAGHSAKTADAATRTANVVTKPQRSMTEALHSSGVAVHSR